jgi:hypothetical protein
MSEYVTRAKQAGCTQAVYVSQVNNWNTGYHIFDEYLTRHLEAQGIEVREERIVINIPPIDPSSLAPSYLNVEIQDRALEVPEYERTVAIVNLGFPQAGPEITNTLYMALERYKLCIFVLHDVKFAKGLLKKPPTWFQREDVCFEWAPPAQYLMSIDSDLPITLPMSYVQLLSLPNSVLFAPSQFMYDLYRKALGRLASRMVLQPHPMDELLDLYRPLKLGAHHRDRLILTSSQYKSDPFVFYSTLAHLLNTKPGYKIVIPNPNDALDPDQYTNWLASGQVDLLSPSPHAQLLYLMTRAEMYLDFSHYQESFGFMAREALALGCKVYVPHTIEGALREVSPLAIEGLVP